MKQYGSTVFVHNQFRFVVADIPMATGTFAIIKCLLPAGISPSALRAFVVAVLLDRSLVYDQVIVKPK